MYVMVLMWMLQHRHCQEYNEENSDRNCTYLIWVHSLTNKSRNRLMLQHVIYFIVYLSLALFIYLFLKMNSITMSLRHFTRRLDISYKQS